MKKLIIALSALGAAFTATAKADIAVSGSSNVAYVSTAGTGDNEEVLVGSTVAFSMSTTTASGMGISAGMTMSQDYDAAGAGGGVVTGGQAVTFSTGGATIVVGDVEISDTTGSVGGVVNGPLDDASDLDTSVAGSFSDDDGLGVELTTAVGTASLNISYVSNHTVDNYGVLNSSTAGDDSAMSASISVPMSGYTVTLGVADSDTGESSAGASVSGAIGGGTVTVGYSNQTLIAAHADLTTAGDSEQVGATYSMSLDADTTIALGYISRKDADSESDTKTELSVERALGGGATVYLDLVNLTGDTAANADGTAIAFGTSVSF